MAGDDLCIAVWRPCPAVRMDTAWHRNSTETQECVQVSIICKDFLHVPTCVPFLKVLPKAEPWQMATLASSLGKVGAPKVELAHFYDALGHMQNLVLHAIQCQFKTGKGSTANNIVAAGLTLSAVHF